METAYRPTKRANPSTKNAYGFACTACGFIKVAYRRVKSVYTVVKIAYHFASPAYAFIKTVHPSMKIANRLGEVACRLVKTSDRNLPMAIRSGGDMDVHRVIGQQIRYFLGPFNEAIRTRVEIIFIRSEEHTSELQSLMRISYAVFCLK